MNKKILLVGTVSNVAKTIEKELRIVLNALSLFESVEVFLVESDSMDQTSETLERIHLNDNNIKYISLGELRESIPNRIDRLRYCRNQYVKFIRDNYQNKVWDFVAVADLDGMNSKLTVKSIKTCFINSPHWDGVMANQKHGYYDLLALRAEGWMENDCFELLNELKHNEIPFSKKRSRFLNFFSEFNYYDNLRYRAIYSKMFKIDPASAWIRVKSAFGGFAIYKTELFISYTYDHVQINGKSTIDHVDFNLKCSNNKAIFYVNPSLINSNWNIYNLNKLKFIRFSRELKKHFKRIVN